MKKILPLILAAALMLSLAACGGNNEVDENSDESGTNTDTSVLEIGETITTDYFESVSYTHLDVYKRQGNGACGL